MNLLKLWEAWPIVGPWHLSPLSGGKNNRVWRAEAADGQCYVLRLTPDLLHIPRIRYEAALLEILFQQQTPFLLPLPIRAHDGDIIVPFEQETGTSAFVATLSPLLPGHMPDRNDLAVASNAGFALAWLDRALVALPEMHFPEEIQIPPKFGELAHLHPLVPDPLAAVEQLPIDRDHAGQIRDFLTIAMETGADLYRWLPHQMLHRDYDPSNILVENQQVTAVLDFEFVGKDIRALDVCVALSWWPVNLLGTGKEWEVIDAFGGSYVTHFPLSEQELLAFPDIWRLRDATSLVYRMGRYLAGLETDTHIQGRVQHSLWREAWLLANQETLLHHALMWRKGERAQDEYSRIGP
ncbi:MAG: phosphotransferase [Chloroflexota bacterium]|nr:phosphotransferase [Chloroflexota bacterium]